MLLVLVVILLLIWAAVVWSIYSNFLVFYSSFNESENYHKAYYNSISSLERAELITKQRAPWYEWSWWIVLWIWKWSSNNSDWWPDKSLAWFSYLWDQASTSTIFRTINSRTSRIPKEKEWDVESMLAYHDADDQSNNSNNYNMMDYDNSQIFLLYYDNSTWNPYNKISCQNEWECTNSSPEIIEWVIRLPKKISTFFEGLDTTTSLTSNSPANDPIVDWQIRGKYSYDDTTYPFNIFATQKLFVKPTEITILENNDNAIRENDINWDNGLNFSFWWENWSPIGTRWNKAALTLISPQESNIKKELDKDTNKYFKSIFSNEKYTEKQLRFSLLNLLKTKKDMIYPFLEYYVDFWTDVSDRYFKIDAEGSYNDYKINTIVWKPTNKESVLWNFTTIF